jgi:hypothetical protein
MGQPLEAMVRVAGSRRRQAAYQANALQLPDQPVSRAIRHAGLDRHVSHRERSTLRRDIPPDVKHVAVAKQGLGAMLQRLIENRGEGGHQQSLALLDPDNRIVRALPFNWHALQVPAEPGELVGERSDEIIGVPRIEGL